MSKAIRQLKLIGRLRIEDAVVLGSFLLCFIFIIKSIVFAQNPYYPGWRYKVKIRVNNPGPARTNYPVRIEVPTTPYINAGRMNSDLRDIRFSQGNTALPFWIHPTKGMERNCYSLPIYVRIANFNQGDNFIYMHFDKNKTATDSSPLPSNNPSYLCNDAFPSGVSDWWTSTYAPSCPGLPSTSFPFSGRTAGQNVFSLFAYDRRDSVVWNTAGTFRTDGDIWINKTKFSNNILLHTVMDWSHANNIDEINIYFLNQQVSSSASSLETTNGYRLFVDGDSYQEDYTHHNRIRYFLRLQRRTATENWTTLGSSTWYVYTNRTHDCDIKVTPTTIKVLINDFEVLSYTRGNDGGGNFIEGYVGCRRIQFAGRGSNNSPSEISPQWVINNYNGTDPIVEVIGNPDLELKKIRPAPVAPEDPNYYGKNLIEYPPAKQIREGYVWGNTFDKYIYRAYQMASLDQTFEYRVKIWNRGNEADTFTLYITDPTTPQKELDLKDWNLAYKYPDPADLNCPVYPNLPGGTSTLIGTITNISAGGSYELGIIAVPGEKTLFSGGKLDFVFKVEGGMDMCMDTARFISNVRPRLDCYWQKKLPIYIQYYDRYNTGDLLDYQVLIKKDDLPNLSNARDDGADVIFTDNDGGFIPFWIKKWDTGNKKGSFWVKVPRIKSEMLDGYSPFDFAIFSDWEQCYVGGGGAPVVNGSVHSNNRAVINNCAHNIVVSPHVNDSELTGCGGGSCPDGSPNPNYSGDIPFPELDLNYYRPLAQAAGRYYNTSAACGNNSISLPTGGGVTMVELTTPCDINLTGNQTGNGTLIIVGANLNFAGNVNFTGLVYVKGGNFEMSGTSHVTGQIIVQGSVKVTGTNRVSYVKQSPVCSNCPPGPPRPKGTATTTIWLYYGNLDYPVSKSNKEETFDLWEDWEGRTLSTPPEVVGCPDGTTDCSGKPDDPDGWQNFPTPAANYNWWKISDKGENNSKAVMADKGSSFVSDSIGPFVINGDVRWKNYEIIYSFYGEYDNYNLGKGSNPQWNPVYYQDPGNSWGMEFYAVKSPSNPAKQTYNGLFIFRPYIDGRDIAWTYQSRAGDILGENFPRMRERHWVKVRPFYNPLDKRTYLSVLINKRDKRPPGDEDYDTDYQHITERENESIPGYIADPAFSLEGGAIGFSGWNGGFSYDNIRVRKFVYPEPTYSVGSPVSITYRPITSLSFPNITQPLMEGRSCLVISSLKPWSWQGDLFAYYADCYIGGRCKKDEVQTKTYTISLWGNTGGFSPEPKGFGEHLKEAEAKDNNRALIDDPKWKENGRKIYTTSDNKNFLDFNVNQKDTLINLLFKPDDLGSQTEVEKLIRFVRGKYIAGYPRSEARVVNQGVGSTSDTNQWKLGDIIHSNPLVVGIPVMTYNDFEYTKFVGTHSKRELVAYFGSNDGMIHCVRLAKWDKDNKRYVNDEKATELWAFIPNGLLGRLKETTDTEHEYTMDGLLRAVDIKDETYPDKYKTILVGTLRTGGQSIFALDITNPQNPSLMWEINEKTNPTEFDKIGKSFSAPALGRLIEGNTNTDRWVGIFGSGLHPNSANNLFYKKAYLTIVNLKTGKIIKQIAVSNKIGNITSNIALLRGFTGEIKKLYFGDYFGAVWSIDLTTQAKVTTFMAKATLTTTVGNNDLLFKSTDYDPAEMLGAPPERPVPSQPIAGCSDDKNEEFMLYFPTGDYDIYNGSYPNQRVYGLKEWERPPAGYYQDSDEPLNLKDMTCSDDTEEESFFIELGHNPADIAGCTNMHDYDYKKTGIGTVSTKDRNERCLSTPDVFSGYLFFTTFTPNTNLCEGGLTRFYSVGFETGAYEEDLIRAVLGMEDVRSVCYSNIGVPSSPMIYYGEGKVAAGMMVAGTGDLINVEMNLEKFLKYINIILWREKR